MPDLIPPHVIHSLMSIVNLLSSCRLRAVKSEHWQASRAPGSMTRSMGCHLDTQTTGYQNHSKNVPTYCYHFEINPIHVLGCDSAQIAHENRLALTDLAMDCSEAFYCWAE